jgi:hypothetical protein
VQTSATSSNDRKNNPELEGDPPEDAVVRLEAVANADADFVQWEGTGVAYATSALTNPLPLDNPRQPVSGIWGGIFDLYAFNYGTGELYSQASLAYTKYFDKLPLTKRTHASQIRT